MLVPNRFVEIEKKSDDSIWLHVPTKQIPADIMSRGADEKEAAKSIWFLMELVYKCL